MTRSARRHGGAVSAFGIGLFASLAAALLLVWSDLDPASTAMIALATGVAVTALVAGAAAAWLSAAAVAIGASIGLGAAYSGIARSEDSDPPVLAGLVVAAMLVPALFGVAALAAVAGKRRRALLQRMRHAVSRIRQAGGAAL